MKTIKIKQTWQSTLPVLLTVFRDGNAEGRKLATMELQRMAKIADAHVKADGRKKRKYKKRKAKKTV